MEPGLTEVFHSTKGPDLRFGRSSSVDGQPFHSTPQQWTISIGPKFRRTSGVQPGARPARRLQIRLGLQIPL